MSPPRPPSLLPACLARVHSNSASSFCVNQTRDTKRKGLTLPSLARIRFFFGLCIHLQCYLIFSLLLRSDRSAEARILYYILLALLAHKTKHLIHVKLAWLRLLNADLVMQLIPSTPIPALCLQRLLAIDSKELKSFFVGYRRTGTIQ